MYWSEQPTHYVQSDRFVMATHNKPVTAAEQLNFFSAKVTANKKYEMS